MNTPEVSPVVPPRQPHSSKLRGCAVLLQTMPVSPAYYLAQSSPSGSVSYTYQP